MSMLFMADSCVENSAHQTLHGSRMACERPVHMHHTPPTVDEAIALCGIPGGTLLFTALSVGNDIDQVVVQHREVASGADDHLGVGELVAQDVELALEELAEVRLHGLAAIQSSLRERVEIGHVLAVHLQRTIDVTLVP